MNRSNISFLGSILIALSIAGYPAISSLSIFLGIDNRFISIPFRILIILISLYIIFIKFRTIKLKLYIFWLIWWFFWTFYILRLIIDFLYFPENLRIPLWEYISYIIGTCLLPATACYLIQDNDVLKKAFIYIYWLLLITCFSVILTLPFEFIQSIKFDDLFNIRLETPTLNSISISHVGFMLATLALIKLYNHESTFKRIILLIIFSFGILFGNSGGSRGPFVAFIISILFFFTLHLSNSTRKKDRFIFFLFLSISIGFMQIAISLNSTIIRRISNFDPSDEIRLSLFMDGFNIFIDNFFLGAGIEPLGFWPHNTILEAFMLNGIFSGILYLGLLLISYLKCIKIIIFHCNQEWLVILYIQFCLIAMVNSSLYQSTQLWAIMAVIMGIRTIKFPTLQLK